MQLNRYRGFSKLPILLVILLLCAAGLYIKKRFVRNDQTPMDSTAPPARSFVATAAARPRGSVVYLPTMDTTGFNYPGLTTRELYRQALLIAARDGLGLQTRDGSLREWATEDPPAANSLAMSFNNLRVELTDFDQTKNIRWQTDVPAVNLTPVYNDLVRTTEKWSRGEFLSAMKSAGWKGAANAVKEDAPASGDAEARVDDMEELTQLAVLRETHALIRQDGESLPRLGILVRGYANLGLLTRYHWSAEYAVYTARSLLYAQRMVALHPHSAFARWHRGYARALAGCIDAALTDFDDAKSFPNETAPPWALVLEDFCNYQPTALSKFADGNSQFKAIARLLALMAILPGNSQAVQNRLAQATYAADPKCLLILDMMLQKTGPGLANDLVDVGPRVFSHTLAERLEYLPGFPAEIRSQIDDAKRTGGGAAVRAIICDELIDRGSPASDPMEPSLAAAGRLVEEVGFALTRWNAYFITEEQGGDASDYVTRNRPLFKDHPFSSVIETYGLMHTNADRAAVQFAAFRAHRVNAMLTVHETPIYFLDEEIQAVGPQVAAKDNDWFEQNCDCSAFDIAQFYRYIGGPADDAFGANLMGHLNDFSSKSPMLMEARVQAHWDPAAAPQIESAMGDYPNVLLAIGRKYDSMQRWSDAERCFRKCLAISPDFTAYGALAHSYAMRKDDADWLKTWNSYLADAPDVDLEHERAEMKIADYYMEQGDFQAAAKYADAAAGSGASWAGICQADAHTGLGEFEKAQQMIRDVDQAYDRNQFTEFCWCKHTGHGDAAGLESALRESYAAKSSNMTSIDFFSFGCLQQSEQQIAEATVTFKQLMREFPRPYAAAHLILLADEMHDAATRDAVRNNLAAVGGGLDTPMGYFAALLGDACVKPPAEQDAEQRIESFLQDEECDVDDQAIICTLWGLFLDDHNRSDRALVYFKRAAAIRGFSPERLVCEAALRRHHLDPWALDTASRSQQSAPQSAP